MYQKLFTKLFEILAEMKNAGDFPHLEAVEVVNPDIFPYVSLVESDTAEDEMFFDSMSNTVVYNFRIRVVNQNNTENLADTAEVVRALVDTILEKIRKTKDWDYCVQNVTTNVRWGWMNEENRRVADIGVNFRVLLDVL